MRGGTNERTDKRTNERTKVPCVLQDIVPFKAAAQKRVKIHPYSGEREEAKGVVGGWRNTTECRCNQGADRMVK